MSYQKKLKQYRLIIERVQHKNLAKPNIDDILDYLEEHNAEMSSRTFLRTKDALFTDFGIKIEHNGSYKYFINYEESNNVKILIDFLNIAMQAQFVAGTMKDFKNLSQYIHLSSSANFTGIHLLQPLLEAIKEQKEIEFKHENYFTFKLTPYTIQPYLLKEYLNRWYVVGFVPSKNEFRTFGIDRIKDFKELKNKFKRNTKTDPRKFFEDTIGLVYTEHELQEVVIQATAHQAKYIETLPLHESQEPLLNHQFKLTLTPNYELIQRILMMGREVYVLRPQWLRDEIKGILEDSLKHY